MMDIRTKRQSLAPKRTALGAPKVTLERVIGLTASTNSQITLDRTSGTVAYPAGCVVVLQGRHSQEQIINTSRKTVTALSFSHDGKYIAVGESGHMPSVRVFEVASRLQVSQLQGHKFGVNCVAFSPNTKYLVSVGTQHDMVTNVWNWKQGTKITSNRISSKVNAIAFSSDGNMFVTAGVRHIKYWFLDESKRKTTNQSRNETIPLLGRNGLLGEQKNNTFVDVRYGVGAQADQVYAITQHGLLCQLNDRQLVLTVQLKRSSDQYHKTIRAYCLQISETDLIVGCADGIIRIFDAATLQYKQTLPKPHPLGVDVLTGSMGVPWNQDFKYPDTIGLVYEEHSATITCIYSDHSLYVWDISQLPRVAKLSSCLYHSSCVWDVDVLLGNDTPGSLPNDTFITSSSDDTIRLWNLQPHAFIDYHERKATFNQELLGIIYTDSSLGSICELEYNSDKPDIYESRNGVRCLKPSPDGIHLASGDLIGNIRIHDLRDLSEVQVIEAHDSAVLALEYSDFSQGYYLMASASRDRIVHLFDAANEYQHLQALSDHSSSVCAVKLIPSDDKLLMLSCANDKSLLFRLACYDDEEGLSFVLRQNLLSKGLPNDMAVDKRGVVATACHDRFVRLYNSHTGKQKRSYKGSAGEEGSLLKLSLDPTFTLLATCSSDKSVCILDYTTGEILVTLVGHSEQLTGVKFLHDLMHLITTSADGCVFIWKLDPRFTDRMRSKTDDGSQTRLTTNRPDVTLVSPTLSPRDPPLSPRDAVGSSGESVSSGLPEEADERTFIIDKPLLTGPLPAWTNKSSDFKDTVVTRGKWDTDQATPVMTSFKNGQVFMSPDSSRIAQSSVNVLPIAVENQRSDSQGDGEDETMYGEAEDTNLNQVDMRTIQYGETVYYEPSDDSAGDEFAVEKLEASRRLDDERSSTSDAGSLLTLESEDDARSTPGTTPLHTPITTPMSPTTNIVDILQQQQLASISQPIQKHGILKMSSLKKNLDEKSQHKVTLRAHTSPANTLSATPRRPAATTSKSVPNASLTAQRLRLGESPYTSTESLATSEGTEDEPTTNGRQLPKLAAKSQQGAKTADRTFSEIDEACINLRTALAAVTEIYSDIRHNNSTETDFLVETLRDVGEVVKQTLPPTCHVQVHSDVVNRIQNYLQQSLDEVKSLSTQSSKPNSSQ